MKRIINDTKELKHIKTKGEIINSNSCGGDKTVTRPNTANGYKSAEEYSREIFQLKKVFKPNYDFQFSLEAFKMLANTMKSQELKVD